MRVLTSYGILIAAVNIPIAVNMRMEQIPRWLLQALRAEEALTVELPDRGADLYVRVHDGPPIRFEVKRFARLSETAARRWLQHWEDEAARLKRPRHEPFRQLLAVDGLTDGARAVLKNAGIAWLERDTGAGLLMGPGLHIERPPRRTSEHSRTTKNNTGQAPPPRPARLRGLSGVVAEVLLGWPPETPVTLGQLAQQSGVSKVLTSRILRRLEREGVVKSGGVRPHRTWQLHNPGVLYDLWAAEEEAMPQVTRLYAWMRTPREAYSRLRKLNTEAVDWALGGVPAANAYAPHLSALPDPVLWVGMEVPPAEIARHLGAEQVSSGANLTIWQTETNAPLRRARPLATGEFEGLPAVSPPRAVVEAARTSGRGADVAAHLREQLLQAKGGSA